MNNRYRYLIKNTGILAISNFSSKLLVFFLVPLYTRVLSTTEYGTYDLIISTIALLYPILTMNIVDSVMRLAMDKGVDYVKLISVAFRFLVIGAMIMATLLIGNNLLCLWEAVIGLEGFIVLYYCFFAFQQLMIQFAKGLERLKDMGAAGVLGTFTMVFFNIILLLVYKRGINGFFMANILGQAVPAVYLAVRIRIWNYIRFEIDRDVQREMLLYCVPLIMSTIGWWVNSASDKYVVTFFCGVAANGLLSIAYKIPTILNTLQGIFIQAWQVSAIKEYDSPEMEHFYNDTFVYLNALMCVGCAVLILLTKPLATILYAKDFYEAWIFVPFLLISSVLNAASGYIGPILSAQKNSKSMAMSAVYGASVNVVLNIGLVYIMGIQGAAIATMVASYTIYIVRKRAIGNILESNNYKWIKLSWIFLIIEASCEIWSDSHLITALFAVGVLLIYSKNVMKVIKKIGR